MTLILTSDQRNALSNLVASEQATLATNPAANYGAAYTLLLNDIAIQQKATGQSLSADGLNWYQQAQAIDTDASGSASAEFVWSADAAGLEWEGKTATAAAVQAEVNDTAAAVLGGIARTGIVQDITALVSTDASVDLSAMGLTAAGWGEAFYYWNACYSAGCAGGTIGGTIAGSLAETQEFLTVSAVGALAALYDPASQVRPVFAATAVAALQPLVNFVYNGVNNDVTLGAAQAPSDDKRQVVGRALAVLDGHSAAGDPDTIELGGVVYRAFAGGSWASLDGTVLCPAGAATAAVLNQMRGLILAEEARIDLVAKPQGSVQYQGGTTYVHTAGSAGDYSIQTYSGGALTALTTTLQSSGTSYTTDPSVTLGSETVILLGNGETATSTTAHPTMEALGQNDTLVTAAPVSELVAAGTGTVVDLTGGGQVAHLDVSQVLGCGTGGTATVNSSGNTIQLVRACAVLPCGSVARASGTVSLVGYGNDLFGGVDGETVSVTGSSNAIVGGCGAMTVNLVGYPAVANVVIGGAGPVVVNSSAVATGFIGGSGSATVTINADGASVALGSGCFTGTINSNGANIETGSGTATIALNGGGGVVVTGSGTTCLTQTGYGAIMLQGDPNGHASFSATGSGDTIFGGDYVSVHGQGMSVQSRAAGFTGFDAQEFDGVLDNLASFAGDPVVAAALEGMGAYIGPRNVPGYADATVPTATSGGTQAGGGGCQPCGSARVIDFAASGSSVGGDSRFDVITVNGSNDSLSGGTGGRIVVIQSGTDDYIHAGAANNRYVNDGQANLLDYTTVPGAATVDLLHGVAANGFGGYDVLCGFTMAQAGSGSTLIAGAASAQLSVLGDNGLMRGGLGSDVLYGGGNGNTLKAGSGNALLHTTGTGSQYVLGDGTALAQSVEIDQESLGVTGSLKFLAGVTAGQLWFSQDTKADLVIDVLGTNTVVTVDNWFGAAPTQLASITTASGTIGNAAINAMVAAMGTYQAGHAGFNPAVATALPGDAVLGTALAAALHA